VVEREGAELAPDPRLLEAAEGRGHAHRIVRVDGDVRTRELSENRLGRVTLTGGAREVLDLVVQGAAGPVG